jgi:hypothetical protein
LCQILSCFPLDVDAFQPSFEHTGFGFTLPRLTIRGEVNPVSEKFATIGDPDMPGLPNLSVLFKDNLSHWEPDSLIMTTTRFIPGQSLASFPLDNGKSAHDKLGPDIDSLVPAVAGASMASATTPHRPRSTHSVMRELYPPLSTYRSSAQKKMIQVIYENKMPGAVFVLPTAGGKSLACIVPCLCNPALPICDRCHYSLRRHKG